MSHRFSEGSGQAWCIARSRRSIPEIEVADEGLEGPSSRNGQTRLGWVGNAILIDYLL